MGFYSERIIPRLCDFFLNRPAVARHRQELLAAARGEVLEIGFGTGLNVPHYPDGVRRITCAEPNAGMHRLARKRIRNSTIELAKK